jgi:hypothetical protein
VPDSVLTCGPGTHLEGARCLPDPPLTCGPGTRLEGNTCVSLGGYYDLRVESTLLWANGYFKYRLLAIGRRPDGSAADDEVEVVSERPSAGTFSTPRFPLGLAGTELWFTPCSSADPGCAGPTRFHLVRAADPSVVLASTPAVELRAPPPVGSAAECLGGGNAFSVEGSKALYGTRWVYRSGTFASHVSPPSAPSLVQVDLQLDDPPFATRFGSIAFSTEQLGQPLRVQPYDDIFRYPWEQYGHPGLLLDWNGVCNDLWGRFEVRELSVVDGTLRRLTATFEEWCAETFVTVGCIHIEQ